MIELLFGFTPAPIEQKTLTLIETPPAQVQQVKQEPTVEEKIKSNYYKCNTDTQWIRADNAQCLPKQPTTPISTQSTIKSPIRSSYSTSNGLNGYDYPSCTGHVALKRYVPRGWGNATDWKYHAQAEGWTVSSTPVTGAIAWRYGHVAYVEAVGDGFVTISENNFDRRGSTRTITIPVDNYLYLYN